MTTTTDTPRTDAVFSEPCAIHQVMQKWEKIIENSRQLERELNDAKSWLDERYKALSEADERAEKAEAEVERLRSTMRSFILVSPIEMERMEKLEAEVERLRDEFLKSIVKDELQKKIIIKQHEILCQHGLSEYGN